MADNEQPRFLAARSEVGYVDRADARAMRNEPEAVSAAEQADLTRQAHERSRQEQQRAWSRAHSTIRRALDDFAHSGPVDRAVTDAAKAVARAAKRVDRLVGL